MSRDKLNQIIDELIRSIHPHPIPSERMRIRIMLETLRSEGVTESLPGELFRAERMKD